ncbi:DUF6165 family protein [Methylocystis sp. JR02]|uniref:DUF6165 family protein n=1 Tax=Methylocystis sp. JR02 TaxID=3046284 RepID=UPI0024BA5AE8|nr:DUF6165 family protein [Methylocystis sp. JR02]MDJ0447111.1 DUF6165 family protein [Methylocystis sp. JR02]
MSNDILAPISVGELFDKITILEIKSERIADPDKLVNVNHEMRLLRHIAEKLEIDNRQAIGVLFGKLKDVNSQIWEAEDRIRDFERRGVFDEAFLATARSIYRLNDARAAAKRELNLLTSSSVVEEKSYSDY